MTVKDGIEWESERLEHLGSQTKDNVSADILK